MIPVDGLIDKIQHNEVFIHKLRSGELEKFNHPGDPIFTKRLITVLHKCMLFYDWDISRKNRRRKFIDGFLEWKIILKEDALVICKSVCMYQWTIARW